MRPLRPVVRQKMAGDIIYISGDDKEIRDAILEAQRRLPEFQRIVEENNRHVFPPYGVPMVKICVENETAGTVEHIWLEGVYFEESEVAGTVVDQTTEYRSPISKVTDWMYFEGEKMHGGFVERILMKRAGIDE